MKPDRSRPTASDPKAILRARAQALARRPQEATSAQSMLELLEFRLAHERYAIETRHVREVYPFRDLTPVPCTPPFVLGIVNLRGRITPVIDLKKFFGLPEQGVTDLHRIILIGDAHLEFGLLADVVVGVRSVAADTLQSTLPTLSGIRDDYLKGVTEQGLVVLDVDRILIDSRIIVNEEVGS